MGFVTMPKGTIKQITPIMTLGARVTESAPGTYTEEVLNLPLNPQLRQVFVITDVEIRTTSPEVIAVTTTDVTSHLAKVAMTTTGNFDDPLVVAINLAEINFTGPNAVYIPPINTPRVSTGDITQDYLSIVATDNLFLAVQGNNNVGVQTATCKVTGYMAEVSADVFAALVVAERPN